MQLTEVELQIMSKLHMFLDGGESVSLSDLSDECHVAQSTIIKLSKKLGYTGFVEMRFKLLENRREKDRDTIRMFDNVINGDMTNVVQYVSDIILSHSKSKNIVHKENGIDILGNYISRKFAMFDIFAPATYDYSMTKKIRLNSGFIIFPDVRRSKIDYLSPMFKTAKDNGFFIITVSNEKKDNLKNISDYHIEISNDESGIDLYNVKVMILFEIIFSLLGKGCVHVNE